MCTKFLSAAFPLLLLLNSFSLNAQTIYERGYFIDNDNNRIDCFIKNLGWKNNPTEFEYKLEESDQPIRQSITSAGAFGVGEATYFRFQVEIDRRGDNFNQLDYKRNPTFQQETLYLKKLVHGHAELYYYEDGNIRRFYFRINGGGITSLIYKEFKNADEQIEKNESYKQQLFNSFKCDKFSEKATALTYNSRSLTTYFRKYNKCVDPSYEVLSKNKRPTLRFGIRPGLVVADFSLDNDTYNTRDVDFGVSNNLRIGLEIEATLPFSNGKWAIPIEPTYLSYSADGKLDNGSGQDISVSYSGIELPIGVRYYIFLGQDSKLLVTAAFTFNLPLGESMVDFATFPDLNFESRWGSKLGFGYTFKRYTFEVKYSWTSRFLGTNPKFGSDFYISNFKELSFVVGYRFGK